MVCALQEVTAHKEHWYLYHVQWAPTEPYLEQQMSLIVSPAHLDTTVLMLISLFLQDCVLLVSTVQVEFKKNGQLISSAGGVHSVLWDHLSPSIVHQAPTSLKKVRLTVMFVHLVGIALMERSLLWIALRLAIVLRVQVSAFLPVHLVPTLQRHSQG